MTRSFLYSVMMDDLWSRALKSRMQTPTEPKLLSPRRHVVVIILVILISLSSSLPDPLIKPCHLSLTPAPGPRAVATHTTMRHSYSGRVLYTSSVDRNKAKAELVLPICGHGLLSIGDGGSALW